jgi:thiol-disulfide isomerase/thioredoxin
MVAETQPVHPLSEFIPLDQPLVSKESLDDEGKRPTFGQLCTGESAPKLIGLYYSMHNCPPCREFTPMLADLYNELN